MKARIVVVMAKSPVPGQVKTRLVPPLTHGQAALVAGALLRDTVANAVASGADVVISLAGPADPIRRLVAAADIAISPQRGATFADRLRSAQREAFDAGADRVLLLAADCPTAGPDLLIEAFDALSHADAAICPAHDGGYALLVTDRPTPVLFDGIEMGTDRVHAQTVARAGEAGLSLHALSARHDVDRLSDVRAAAADGQLAAAPTTLALVIALGLLDHEPGPARGGWTGGEDARSVRASA